MGRRLKALSQCWRQWSARWSATPADRRYHFVNFCFFTVDDGISASVRLRARL